MVLHSLLADRHAFDPVLPALAAKHRVTLINLPGFHGSQPTPLALMDAYVAAIEDGFDEFKIAKDAVLIGNGFGGTVALAFALPIPSASPSWCSSDAAACFPPEGRQAFAVMAQKVAESGLGAVAEIAAKRVHSPAYLHAHPEAIEERKDVLLGIDPKAFQAACKILQESDLTPLLHHCRCRRWSCAASSTRRRRRRSTRQIARRWRARAMSNCPAAAIARRWSSRRRFSRRSRNSWGL